ncbi:MAG: hypothetical protein ACT4OM_12835 [Actinomycetota bacterium]
MIRRAALALSVLAASGLTIPAQATEAVRIDLSAQAESGVTGTATLTFSPPDTIAHVELGGLAPGTKARISIQEGGCDGPRKTFSTLPDTTADSQGKAVADGLVLIDGEESVALATVADGAHSVSIVRGDAQVACGEVLRVGAVAPASSQASGAEPPWFFYALIATAVVLAAGGIIFKRQKNGRSPAE